MKKLIGIRFSSLGDLVLTSPFWENIKLNWPRSFLWLVTKEAYAPLFDNNPFVDRLLLFNGRNLMQILEEIRKIHPDAVFDLHDSLRSRLLKMFIPGRKWTVNKEVSRRKRMLGTKEREPLPPVRDRYLELIEASGGTIRTKKTGLFLSPAETESAKIYLREKNFFPCDLIAVFPFARWKAKEWPVSKWLSLIEGTYTPHLKIIIFGDDFERGEKLYDSLSTSSRMNVLNLCGKTSIRDLCSFLSVCRLAVAPDSAAVHLANALDIPVLALFGPTVPQFGFAPLGEKDTVIETELSCRPCH
ncbi:MAG TPA: glycosyltransferase family 9 protein, partial [bacterium]|nr:glycosyltransferase family 9 protein [bacterium]